MLKILLAKKWMKSLLYEVLLGSTELLCQLCQPGYSAQEKPGVIFIFLN